jgi:hypothetical protein
MDEQLEHDPDRDERQQVVGLPDDPILMFLDLILPSATGATQPNRAQVAPNQLNARDLAWSPSS